MKRGIIVSDLHCGSFYGMLPQDFITYENIPKPQNTCQQYLWPRWLDFVTLAEEFDPDFVVANGDLVDGLQSKQHGAELTLPSWRDQREASIKTLRVLRSATKRAKWYHTQGTPYHTGHFGAAEEDIAKAMNAEKYESVGTGEFCREVLKLEFKDENFVLEAAHHIGFSQLYAATQLQKELLAICLHSGGQRLPNLIIRSHIHTQHTVESDGMRIATSPCWQLQTRFARRRSVHLLQPDIGGLFITIDKGRCDVWPKMYEVPPLPITEF